MNITLIGFMGAGKTAVGKRLAKRLGWQFVDVDALIEASAKSTVAKIFAEHGEAVFRRLEKRVIRRVIRCREQVIATGGGTFLDPVNQRLLKAVGPVVCLTAHPKTILQRVGPASSMRPLLAAEPTVSRIQQLMTQRASDYAKADLTIDTTDLTSEEVAEKIWMQIGPWISKSWQYLLKHHDKLTQRYGGQYIAVLDDHIVAAGATHLQAYQAIRCPVPSTCEVGIYYIPLAEESPIAL